MALAVTTPGIRRESVRARLRSEPVPHLRARARTVRVSRRPDRLTHTASADPGMTRERQGPLPPAQIRSFSSQDASPVSLTSELNTFGDGPRNGAVTGITSVLQLISPCPAGLDWPVAKFMSTAVPFTVM